MGFCFKGLKNEFETTMVNEPSVFEPLKFYCTKFYLPDVTWPLAVPMNRGENKIDCLGSESACSIVLSQ